MLSRATSSTTVVVDDEKLSLEELSFLLRDFPEVEVVGSGTTASRRSMLIEELEPDLVFLDVQMPGLDGMGVIRALRERIPRPALFCPCDRLRSLRA